MCARRFLFVIFFLTLLVVGAAFAIFQFGDRALTRMATPQGHFQAPPAADTGPDYKVAANWLARPGNQDRPADWLPDGMAPETQVRAAATFYIHPTTYLDRDRWNAPLDLTGDAADRARLFVTSQASAFNAVSEVWAPKYRQAAFGAFLLKSADATAALDLAYRDVLSAFDAFLAAQPAGRPIILAGHSQGSLHLSRLLVDRKEALNGRLVAAYVVGWPLSASADLPAMGVSPCAAPDESGCLLAWQSFKDPANPSLVLGGWSGGKGYAGSPRRPNDMICVNPISGQAGATASAADNMGTLVPDGAFNRADIVKAQVGARCSEGLLFLDGVLPELGPYVLPGNNYHVYDYALFWGSIREDVSRRLAAWQKR